MTAYVVTFEHYRPGERVDGRPWTQARIDEATGEDGPYTTIDTLPLIPVDTNPAAPRERTLTTEAATVPDGWYQVVWLDDIGGEQPTSPIHNTDPTVAYQPAVWEVAAYVRARTKDTSGGEAGTFTFATSPTDTEVRDIIRVAAGKVASRFGTTVAASLALAAREVVALRAAMLVELTFFGDQIQAGRSPYTELKELYEQAYTDLLEARKDLGADALAGTGDDLSAAGLPASAYPAVTLCHVPGSESPWPDTWPLPDFLTGRAW